MSFLDIILGGLLAYSFYKGIRNGLFVELASLISLLVGIYFAVKFSSFMKGILAGFLHWNVFGLYRQTNGPSKRLRP